MSNYFNVCPHCGATLDPGERCECLQEKRDPVKTKPIKRQLPHQSHKLVAGKA